MPQTPNFARDYQAGIDISLRNQPRFIDAENQFRQDNDPQRIAAQQNLQATFGPTMYAQQLDALHQLDPASAAVRSQLGGQILGDLQSGYDLPPEYARQIQQNVRGAQAARGNILGNGAAGVEAGVMGKAALDLYQQHITNAGNFLGSPTPEQQLLAVQGVQPDRSFAYTNPNAGYQGVTAAQGNYQNLLAAQQLQNNNSTASIWGPIVGQVGGAVVNGAFNWLTSDDRLKTDIRHIVTTKDGIPIISFRYLGSKVRHIGTRAQALLKLKPEAVSTDANGFYRVDYSQLDVPFFALLD